MHVIYGIKQWIPIQVCVNEVWQSYLLPYQDQYKSECEEEQDLKNDLSQLRLS